MLFIYWSNTLAITSLTTEIQYAKRRLQYFTNTNDAIIELSALLTNADLVLMHLEFTLGVLQSNSTEEINALRKKFSLIGRKLQRISLKRRSLPSCS